VQGLAKKRVLEVRKLDRSELLKEVLLHSVHLILRHSFG
jgi:hypothetical protein